MKCADLVATRIPGEIGVNTHITRVEVVTQPDSQPYCEVEGIVDPAIRFEVRLPTAGWSQRYLQLGCGGLCGSIQMRVDHGQGCVPLGRGEMILATTDMGHSTGGGAWAATDPGAKADFGYRAVHLTAVAAKAVAGLFYHHLPRFSYFSGCSDGGREALIEAQRFPEDFDGISAGAPALNFTVQNSFFHGWNARSNTGPEGLAILTADKLPMLHAAVVEACDGLDGQTDGVIVDPRRCHFDPEVLACKGAATEHCLSAGEVEVVRRIYGGAKDLKGRNLVPGGPAFGSELGWAGVYVPAKSGEPIFSARIVVDSVRYLYFERPLPDTWSVSDLKFDEQTLRSFQLRGLYDATDPDLARFRARGSKLILWHGWSDPHISPVNSIAYFEAVEKLFGAEETRKFIRLFLMPGMGHCHGGDGFFEFDAITPLMTWVERGRPPAAIIAAQLETAEPKTAPSGEVRAPTRREHLLPPSVLRSRPIYPYPLVAKYLGHGDPREASSYVAASGEAVPHSEPWLGESFFVSGYELTCDRGTSSQVCVPAPKP
jgi:feruloyl esterase